MKFKTSLIFLLLFFLIACSEEEVCVKDVNTMLIADFFKKTDGSDTILSNLSVVGLNKTRMLYDSAVNISQIELPLNYNSGKTSFIISINNNRDTITFFYTGELIFVSYACGFAPTFELNDVTATYKEFDSIAVINNIINPDNEENIEIYF